jgi:hypothetical protein
MSIDCLIEAKQLITNLAAENATKLSLLKNNIEGDLEDIDINHVMSLSLDLEDPKSDDLYDDSLLHQYEAALKTYMKESLSLAKSKAKLNSSESQIHEYEEVIKILSKLKTL